MRRGDSNTPSFHRRRVLHLITRMIIGGAEWNTLYTVKLLNKERYAPFLACGPQTGAEGSLIEATKALGVPVLIVPDLVREMHPIKDLKVIGQLIRLYRATKPDIVHTHASKAGIVGRLAAKMAGIPRIIHTVHGFAFTAPIPVWQKCLYIALERVAARCCDTLIFISSALIQEARRWKIGDPNQYVLIPSGIDLRVFRESPRFRTVKRQELSLNGEPIIGTIARIVKEKGYETLLQAACRLKEKGLPFVLVWVGDGPDRPHMEALARQLGLADRVIITGMRNDVEQWVGCFDVFALPTLWEGMGRVFLEAQAAGVPVVGTRVGGVPDVVVDGKTGFLVPPNDPDALSDALLRLLTDDQLRQTMSQAAKIFVDERFSVEGMVQAIEAVYDRA
ncbi:MAG: hypothetical protein LKKZDAJK_000833 [Candidatus Fervidibacter sp.]